MKFEKINHIFILNLLIIFMYSLCMIIITQGKEKIYVISTVTSYGIVLYDSIFMWIYSMKKLNKLLEDDEDKVICTNNVVPFNKKDN